MEIGKNMIFYCCLTWVSQDFLGLPETVMYETEISINSKHHLEEIHFRYLVNEGKIVLKSVSASQRNVHVFV